MSPKPSQLSNDKVKVCVYANNGSISVDLAKNYAQQAKESAEYAKEIADSIAQEIAMLEDKNYVHEQAVAATEWTIEHNLNKYPTATVIDSAGNEIICDIQYLDKNSCVVTMTSPFKGKAILN